MKIDFNIPIKALDGIVNEDLKVHEQLASLLAQDRATKDAIKTYTLASNMYQKGEIDIDTSDFNYIRSFIDRSENIPALLKGQVLEAIDAQKLSYTKNKKGE